MAGVKDSIGPVNPKIIPILMSAKEFADKVIANINAATNIFFIFSPLVINFYIIKLNNIY